MKMIVKCLCIINELHVFILLCLFRMYFLLLVFMHMCVSMHASACLYFM